MKFRKKIGFLISAFVIATVLSVGAVPAEAQTGVNLGTVDAGKFASSHYVNGNWFWGMLSDSALMSGASAVSTDVSQPSVFYVGGPGYIATSSDSGVTWRVTLEYGMMNEVSDASIEEAGEEQESVSNDRLEGLREYIRNGLEEHYDEAFVDSLMDRITDDDLNNAESLEDIDALEGIEWDIETDLSQIQIVSESSSSLVLSEFDSFIRRYEMLTTSGAEPEQAILLASASSAVWDFVSTPNAVYAVSSENIYISTDQGTSWNVFYSKATMNENILSFDISSDGVIVAIGTTDALMLTRNGGADWAILDQVFGGAIFKIDVPERTEDPITVLTTNGLYISRDMGLTWQPVVISNAMHERIIDIMPVESGWYALTDQGLYYSENMHIWNYISLGPVSSENVEQVIVHSTGNKFVVRTEQRIFEYDGEWKLQDSSLMVSETGPLVLLNDGESLSMMVTPSGVWIAQEKEKIEVTPEYQSLYDTWAKEPSDDWVIEQALRAHYLDDWLEIRWGLRSRMAWLLPTVTFNYLLRQKLKSDVTTVTNMRFGVIESEKYKYYAEEIHQWEIMARWNIEIDKAFKKDIDISSTVNRLQVRRYALIKQIQMMLKKRRAYQMTLAIDFPKTSKKKIKNSKKYMRNWLGLQEIDASLNYMTGGAFIPAIQESHKQ